MYWFERVVFFSMYIDWSNYATAKFLLQKLNLVKNSIYFCKEILISKRTFIVKNQFVKNSVKF